MCGVCGALTPCMRDEACRDCSSDNTNQRRISKWKCKICLCVRGNYLRHCGECNEFPCEERRNLDSRYLSKYGIDLKDNVRQLGLLGPERWMTAQWERFTCPECGDVISPYTRVCFACGAVIPR